MTYRIEITHPAFEALQAITDRRTRGAIGRRIDGLAEEPQIQGKALRGWLSGFFSVRAAGQRYRIVYRVFDDRRLVRVYLVGIRKEGSRHDIYALAERLVQRGII
jgi:mRNA interferase RelE/StbE